MTVTADAKIENCNWHGANEKENGSSIVKVECVNISFN